jgi:hypothetical protein
MTGGIGCWVDVGVVLFQLSFQFSVSRGSDGGSRIVYGSISLWSGVGLEGSDEVCLVTCADRVIFDDVDGYSYHGDDDREGDRFACVHVTRVFYSESNHSPSTEKLVTAFRRDSWVMPGRARGT